MAKLIQDPFSKSLLWADDSVAWAEGNLKDNTDTLIGLDPWQKKVLRSTHRYILLNCSRQIGKSTIAAIKAAHRALYWPKSSILLIAPTERQAILLFKKVEDALTQIEKAKVATFTRTEDNKTSITLSNGSQIIAAAATEAGIRGFSSINLLIEDESAYVDDEVHKAVLPTVRAARGQIMMLSTPHGQQGHFYTAWSGTADFDRHRVPVTDVPHRVPPEDVERDRKQFGNGYVEQEYLCKFVSTLDAVFTEEQIKSAISEDIPVLEW